MSDARSLDEIERRVQADREALSQSLDRLAQTVSPDRLNSMAQGYGGELGRQVWAGARRNPAAFALVGAGIALLLSGTGERGAADAGAKADETTAIPPDKAFEGFDERVAAADAAMRAQAGGEPRPRLSSRRMRETVEAGLDRLGPEARRRVLNLRHAAIRAQIDVERRAEKAARQAGRKIGDQPWAAAAVAFGIGALTAALVPVSRREDEMLGGARDALVQDARDALQQEIQNLQEAMAGRPRRSDVAPELQVPS